MTRHKIIVVARECVRQHYQTQRTQPDKTANNEKKNPNVNKYLNKANTVVAAVDSFIMIMRCDLTLRSIWFSFELLLCSMGRLARPSLQYTWKKKEPIFKTKYIMQWTVNRMQVVMQRDPRAHTFILFSVRLIQSGRWCCTRVRTPYACTRSTAFNIVLTPHIMVSRCWLMVEWSSCFYLLITAVNGVMKIFS